MLTYPTPSCSEVRRELEALALAELPRRAARTVRRHLAGCAGCAVAARDVERIVAGLRAIAPVEPMALSRRVCGALAVAACVALVVVLEFRTLEPRLDPCPEEDPGLSMLVAAQALDGAWREAGGHPKGPLTVGLSGLATLSCLWAGDRHPTALAAGERGCEFLVKALAAQPLHEADGPPDLRIRAQAAAAWAVASAAERWPDRYRDEAARALRSLAALEDAWARPEGGLLLDDVTRLLLRSAHDQARALGLQTVARGGHGPASEGLATRLMAYADSRALAGPDLTRLASRVLAGALPKSRTPTF